MLDPGLEVPTGHLPQRKPPTKFIRRNIFLSFTNLVSNVKGFADREFYPMKNGSVSCCFLGFAFGAPP
jgi:hypothetical protein